MRTTYSSLIALIFLIAVSCKSSEEVSTQNVSDSVIATIGDELITIDELRTNFNRNRSSVEADSTGLREFYPSYIDYRLKLHEGYEQGYHQDSTILAEFNDYASEIAYRYWIENELKKERIETFKNRFESELRAFHILKELPQDALPQDTLDVYNELLSVRDSLVNGADPEVINGNYSSQREGRPVGGQLSWITAGSTIQPFEDRVYSLEPGDVSMPVRSQFGYHVILLQEVRPRTPQRLVKHIFVRKNEAETGSEKIQQAYEALQADSSWGDVLQNYTEDPSTQNRDGLLGWIGYGTRFPNQLIEAAMMVNPDSAFSEPYEASYGYHIIKVDSVRTFQDEAQKEEFILNRLEQLGRLEPNREDVFERIATESEMKIRRENFRSLREDSTLRGDQTASDILIQFMDKSYTKPDFQKWLDESVSVEELMESGNLIESYRNTIIENNLVEYTKQAFPEFANQVDHFLNGLIVFKVNEENIWNPDATDRGKLREYYESHKDKYQKEKTLIYTKISASSDSLVQQVHRELTEGLSSDRLSEKYETITVTRDSTSNSQNPVYERLEQLNPGEFSDSVPVNNQVLIYILNEIKEARILSFNEAFDQVFSDYQPIREENYLNQLKEKYQLKLYPENVDS